MSDDPKPRNICKTVCWALGIIAGGYIAYAFRYDFGQSYLISAVIGIVSALIIGLLIGRRFCGERGNKVANRIREANQSKAQGDPEAEELIAKVSAVVPAVDAPAPKAKKFLGAKKSKAAPAPAPTPARKLSRAEQLAAHAAALRSSVGKGDDLSTTILDFSSSRANEADKNTTEDEVEVEDVTEEVSEPVASTGDPIMDELNQMDLPAPVSRKPAEPAPLPPLDDAVEEAADAVEEEDDGENAPESEDVVSDDSEVWGVPHVAASDGVDESEASEPQFEPLPTLDDAGDEDVAAEGDEDSPFAEKSDAVAPVDSNDESPFAVGGDESPFAEGAAVSAPVDESEESPFAVGAADIAASDESPFASGVDESPFEGQSDESPVAGGADESPFADAAEAETEVYGGDSVSLGVDPFEGDDEAEDIFDVAVEVEDDLTATLAEIRADVDDEAVEAEVAAESVDEIVEDAAEEVAEAVEEAAEEIVPEVEADRSSLSAQLRDVFTDPSDEAVEEAEEAVEEVLSDPEPESFVGLGAGLVLGAPLKAAEADDETEEDEVEAEQTSELPDSLDDAPGYELPDSLEVSPAAEFEDETPAEPVGDPADQYSDPALEFEGEDLLEDEEDEAEYARALAEEDVAPELSREDIEKNFRAAVALSESVEPETAATDHRWHPVQPEALDGPIDGTADDLTEIDGVNADVAKELNAIGIFNFSQLVGMNRKELAWLNAEVPGADGSVLRDRWRRQAKTIVNARESSADDNE